MSKREEIPKVVVFDLDETLGYFLELSLFCDCLKLYKNNKFLTQDEFNQLIELYPEFVRPNILPILTYLKHKTEKGECDAVMIYTNNNGPKEWAQHIKSYFESKIDFPLFAQIIAAFKVQGKHIELCRTTYDKTVSDFIRCTKLPKETQICFLDDVYYPKMKYDNVYYIKVKPYIHDLTFDEMTRRFISSSFGKKMVGNNPEQFVDFMNKNMEEFEYAYVEKTKEEADIDKIITKQMMIYLQDFFKNGVNGKSTILNKTKIKKSATNSNVKTKKNR